MEILILARRPVHGRFAVSICKGLAVKWQIWERRGIVGLWFGGFQALMPMIGYFLGSRSSNAIQSVDHWVAFVLLSLRRKYDTGGTLKGTRTRAGIAAFNLSRLCLCS